VTMYVTPGASNNASSVGSDHSLSVEGTSDQIRSDQEVTEGRGCSADDEGEDEEDLDDKEEGFSSATSSPIKTQQQQQQQVQPQPQPQPVQVPIKQQRSTLSSASRKHKVNIYVTYLVSKETGVVSHREEMIQCIALHRMHC
jgi:hypothetical protein